LISGGAPQEFWGAGFGDDQAGNAAATMIHVPRPHIGTGGASRLD
jgi:hypothetical protein